MVVNCTVEPDAGGAVAAELRTDDNKPIHGFTLDDCDDVTQSGFEQTVRWRGKDLSEADTDQFRILFRLKEAAIYTFDIKQARGA